MSSKKKNKIKKNIRDLEKERQQVLKELLNSKQLLRGSVATVYTKCGRENCWCKDGKGHPHTRITWSEKAKGYTRKVPKNEMSWIKKVTENYRNFRSLRRRLKELEASIKELQDKLEDILVSDTRKIKDYLWTKQ